MSDDRFKMIASEMFDEPEMIAPDPDRPEVDLLISSDCSLTCGRCALSAFEPYGNRKVCCRACQSPPLPIYLLPNGMTLRMEVNRYRCGVCARQSQVTMTLSEVNLWCGGCGRLQLHERLAQPSKRTLTKEAQQRLDERVVQAVIQAGREIDRVLEKRDSLLDTPRFRPPRQGSRIDDFRRRLGLEDFDGFATRARNRNAKLVLYEKYVGTDLDRRTGRTTRGILEMLARCVEKQATQVWIVAHSQIYEKDLKSMIRDIVTKLDVEIPGGIRISPLPPGPEPFNVVRYVDHYVSGR